MKREEYTVWMMALAALMIGIAWSLIGPTLPDLAMHVNEEAESMGILFTAGGIGGMVGSLLGGFMVNIPHMQIHIICLSCMFLMGVAITMVPYTSSLVVMCCLNALVGFSNMLYTNVSVTAIIWMNSPAHVLRFRMNLVCATWGLGGILSPLLATWIPSTSPGQSDGAYIMVGVGCMLCTVLFMFAETPENPAGKGDSDRSVNSESEGDNVDIETDPTRPLIGETSTSEKWTPLKKTMATFAVIFMFFSVGAEASYGGWLYTFAIHMFTKEQVSHHEARWMNSMYFISFTISRVVIIMLTAKVKPGRILMTTLPAAAIGTSLLLILQYGHISLAGNEAVVWLAIILVGYGLSAAFANIITYSEQHQLTGSVMNTLFMLAANGGAMGVPYFLSLVVKHTSLDYYGFTWTMLIDTSIAVFALLVCMLLGRRQTKVEVCTLLMLMSHDNVNIIMTTSTSASGVNTTLHHVGAQLPRFDA